MELDPLSLIINSSLAGILDFRREYDEAIEQYKKTLELEPYFPFGLLQLGRVYLHKQMSPEALDCFQKALEISGGAPIARGWIAQWHARHGKREEAIRIVRELEQLSSQTYVPANIIAQIYIVLGDTDAAFEWLDKAYHERTPWLLWLKVASEFEPLRSDPRFEILLEKIGLGSG